MTKWHLLIGIRATRHEFLSTLQGRLVIVVIIVSLPSLFSLLSTGPAGLDSLTQQERLGVLLLAHTSSIFVFLFGMAVHLLKVFGRRPLSETRTQLCFLLREVAIVDFFLAAFLPNWLLTTFLFYLFFSRVLIITLGSALLALLHLLVLTTEFLFLAVLTGWLLRPLIRKPRFRRHTNLTVRLMVLPWFPSFTLMVFGAALLRRASPGALSWLGSPAAEPWLMLQPSLSFVYALSTGRWMPAMVSLTLLAVMTAVSVWCLARWYRVAHREIILDEGGSAVPAHASAFAPERFRIPFSRRSVSGAFWVKDVLVPVRRSSSGYVQQIALALSGSVVSVVFLHFWAESRSSGTGVTCFILTLVTLAVPLIFSAHGCLSSLGMEGTNIALLRPVLGFRRLLYAKSSAQLVFVLAHALVLALAIAFGARLAGLAHPGLPAALGLALAATLAFSATGLALGFGLPDFQRKSMILPGASKLAQFVHMAGGGMVAVGWSLLATAFYLDKIGIVGLVTGIVIPLVLVLGLSAGIGAWSLRSLERLEI